MDRIYNSGAAGTPPAYPASPSSGFPQSANPGLGAPATKPGPYWYYAITEEIRNVIVAAGIAPAGNTVNQLSNAISSLIASGVPPASETVAGKVELATQAEAEAGTSNSVAMTPLKAAQMRNATALGWGQSWQNMTASRAVNTNYTNTTGRPIQVSIQMNGYGSDANLVVDGVAVSRGNSGDNARPWFDSLQAVIPAGSVYSVSFSGGVWSMVFWSELR